MNGIMYVLSPGCQWQAIQGKDVPPRSTVHDYLNLLGATTARSIAFITRFM